MASITLRITDDVGLHARPAAQFVKTAAGFASEIRVTRGERSANAKSLLEVLQLEAGKGAVIELDADGDDATDALAALRDQLDAEPVEG